jgi:hypothetical protein
MDYALGILGMFGLAFVISMFVALIINILYLVVVGGGKDGYLRGQMLDTYRVWRLDYLHYWKTFEEYRKTESKCGVELIRFYYGR